MAERLKLAGHLSAAELRERYERCKDAVEKTHWPPGHRDERVALAQEYGMEREGTAPEPRKVGKFRRAGGI